jgi:hypothetical protein
MGDTYAIELLKRQLIGAHPPSLSPSVVVLAQPALPLATVYLLVAFLVD